MRRRLLFLLAVSVGISAEEPAQTPFLAFREPDPLTRKLIQRDLITEKQLGGQVPDVRRKAREQLARIGAWSTPFLADALYGRTRESSARIRLNAAIALGLIRDPRGLDALLKQDGNALVGAAAKDDDLLVRRASTLVVGMFRRSGDAVRLHALVELPPREWRAVAPALAKLRCDRAATLLQVNAEKLPRDEHDAAAVLISAAIAGPGAPLVAHLEDTGDLIQEACAAGLAVRPLPTQRAGELLAALDRKKLAPTARVLAIRALGAITPRPADAQAKLLEIATRDGPQEERIAAMLELEGRADELDALRKAYGRVRGRNDPITAALLFALARTREREAFDELLSVLRNESDFLKFYAAASLLHVCSSGARPEDPDRLLVPITELKEEELSVLKEIARRLRAGKDVAADVKQLDYPPRDLRLYAFTTKERNWLEVNRLLARIFDLGQVLLQFDSTRQGRTPESPLSGAQGDQTHKAASASDDTQDLFDLILPPTLTEAPGEEPYPKRKPYFVPEDLG